MTDLISRLADAIVALNNASPRLPTKAQVEEVLRKHLAPHIHVHGLMKATVTPVPRKDAELNVAKILRAWGIMCGGSPGTEGGAEAGGITSLMTPRCPGTPDGKHLFNYDIVNDEHRCFCGARARLP